jgi:hypothetical protein
LDRRDLAQLEATLRRAISNSPIPHSVVVIPIQEIEAWLLSDELAISQFFNLRKSLKRVSNPEAVSNPKEVIGRLVQQASGGAKRYVNTLHNEPLVQRVRMSRLRTCKSFGPLERFVVDQIS